MSDQKWVVQVVVGDESVFWELYCVYVCFVYWIVQGILGFVVDVEDVMQEMFVVVWCKFFGFELQGEFILLWLVMICCFQVVNWFWWC